MKILELFAGIGACSKALKRLGIDLEIVDAVEIDKYAIASFNAIHGTNFETQDIATWNKDLKDIDLITHGSPCQDFSVAGKQAGGDLGSGTRSSLMYETIRIVGQIRPKYVLWENVKNLLSAKHKHNFDAYINTMNALGYNSYYQVLNAKDYGIPQNRERVYTISIRKDIDNNNFKFPEKEELKLRLKDMLEDEVDEKYYLKESSIKNLQRNFGSKAKKVKIDGICDTLQAAMGNGGGNVPVVERIGGIFDTEKQKHQAGSIYDKEGISPTLDIMQGGWRQPSIITHNIIQKVKVRKYEVNTNKLKEILRSAKIETEITNNKLAKELSIPRTQIEHYFRKDDSFAIPEPNIWFRLKELLNIKTDEFDESIMTFEEKDGVYDKANRVYDDKGLAPTLTQQEEKIINDYRIRKLTPKECWRLMGFSDEDFEKAKNVPTSNTQLYKQAGNSIVVNVLEKIFKNLF